MSTPGITAPTSLVRRPKRADAARNFDKLLEAARDAFAEQGSEAGLEDIARRAGVGIGTLYRNFPTRRDLLEAVYFDEVDGLSRAAAELPEDPWDALAAWLHHFAGYTATKRAVAQELFAYADREADDYQAARAAVTGTGDALIGRAQEAGVARRDVSFTQVGRLVSAAAAIPGADEEEVARMVDLVLDGLRPR
jgi:AcrR family transcriptional regulator